MNAQVGINTLSPFSGADLDIKNLSTADDIIPRGILIPKLTTKQRNNIDVSSTEANSLLIYNIDDDCYNYYSVLNADWMSLCGEQSAAQLETVTCDNIEVVGTYIKGVEMNSSNYLNVTVTVLESGVFSVSGLTSNNYYFSSQETVLDKGTFTFKVPAYGTPSDIQEDDLTLSGNGFLASDLVCTSKINVLEPIGQYSLICAGVNVAGTYLKGIALSSDEYIDVSVSVSVLGSYSISTTKKNGIEFSATGRFTTLGNQTVRLVGSGTPTVNSDFTVDIASNSTLGNTQCAATIPLILPSMTYGIIGVTDSADSWNSAPRTDVLLNEANFSKTGTFKINGLSQLWATDSATDAISYLTSGYSGAYPDVVLFYSPSITQSSDLGTALATYIGNGGYVIYGTTDADAKNTNLILSAIFGSGITAQAQIAGTVTANDVYSIISDSSDPIVNGVFANLSNNNYWGENGKSINSVIVTSLPTNAVQLVSAANTSGKQTVNPIYSMVWYSPKSNFVYFGSSVDASATDTSAKASPAYYLNYAPNIKLYGGGTIQYITNSYLELNALGWCLQQAAITGINQH